MMHKAARLTQYRAPCDLVHDTANRESKGLSLDHDADTDADAAA